MNFLRHSYRLLSLAVLCFVAPLVHAEPATGYGGSILNSLFSLIVVLAVIWGAAFLLRKMPAIRNEKSLIRIVSVVPVGNGQKLMVVESGAVWLLLGVSAQAITVLHTYEVKPEEPGKVETEFSAKLYEIIGKGWNK